MTRRQEILQSIVETGSLTKTAKLFKISKQRVWQHLHVKQHRANKTVKKAIDFGKLARKEICELCGVKCFTEGHHDDYSKRREVRWLCRKCHVVEDRIVRPHYRQWDLTLEDDSVIILEGEVEVDTNSRADYTKQGANMSEGIKERNRGKHLIQLWVKESKYQQIKRAADSVEEPVTNWIRRAVFQSLRKWSPPKADSSMYEPCPSCGKKHDPSEHFKNEDDD